MTHEPRESEPGLGSPGAPALRRDDDLLEEMLDDDRS